MKGNEVTQGWGETSNTVTVTQVLSTENERDTHKTKVN